MDNTNNLITWPGWETVRIIGRGSVGTVYEIRRNMFGTTERCALKHITIPRMESELYELRSSGLTDQEIALRLEDQAKSVMTEYQMMKRLNDCPNVVTCHDVQTSRKSDGLGWDIDIRMELLTPLTERLSRQLDWPEEETVRMGRDLCRALSACQRLKIVHRDVKPQNLFQADDGSYKLGDFGIARIASLTGSATGKKGTFSYMAPEVYKCERYGALADQYSLGMVLYWLLNNRRVPFVTENTPREKDSALKRRMRGEPIPPPAHGSPALQRIILKAVAYDPTCRYPTADDMLRDLENLDAEPESRADPVTPKPNETLDWWSVPAVETPADKIPGAENMNRPPELPRWTSGEGPTEGGAQNTMDVSRPPEFPRWTSEGEFTDGGTQGVLWPGPYSPERPRKPRPADGEETVGVFDKKPERKSAPPEKQRKPTPYQPPAGSRPDPNLYYSRVEDDMRRAQERKQAQARQEKEKKRRKNLLTWCIVGAVLMLVIAAAAFLLPKLG